MAYKFNQCNSLFSKRIARRLWNRYVKSCSYIDYLDDKDYCSLVDSASTIVCSNKPAACVSIIDSEFQYYNYSFPVISLHRLISNQQSPTQVIMLLKKIMSTYGNILVTSANNSSLAIYSSLGFKSISKNYDHSFVLNPLSFLFIPVLFIIALIVNLTSHSINIINKIRIHEILRDHFLFPFTISNSLKRFIALLCRDGLMYAIVSFSKQKKIDNYFLIYKYPMSYKSKLIIIQSNIDYIKYNLETSLYFYFAAIRQCTPLVMMRTTSEICPLPKYLFIRLSKRNARVLFYSLNKSNETQLKINSNNISFLYGDSYLK